MTPENYDRALAHAWDWFAYHANQRMTMIRFYLTLAGALGAGVGYLWVNREFLLSALLGTFGVIASLCFMRLDARVGDLVKLGEASLMIAQKKMADDLAHPPMEMCLSADSKLDEKGNRKPWPYTYGENFRVLFTLAAAGFFVMTVLSLWKIGQPA